MLADIIRFIHICIILFIILTPLIDIFSLSKQITLLQNFTHMMLCICILGHWKTNSNKCGLTILEAKLRNLQSVDESFLYSIIAPIYDYPQQHETYILTQILKVFILISFIRIIQKLYNNPPQLFVKIKNIFLKNKTNKTDTNQTKQTKQTNYCP